MYAKLVVGGTAITAIAAMRDIVRLITSATPSTSLLGGFSTASSIIVDSTAAGWTYVGGNRAADQPTIAATGAATTLDGAAWNLCCSAPCLSGSALKYAVFNPIAYTTYTGSIAGTVPITGFTLTGASSASALGVVTNEGPRIYAVNPNGTSSQNNYANRLTNKYHLTDAASVIHVIANARHITIIQEGRGLSAIWESSMTDAHTFYGTAPFVQYCHYYSPQYGTEGVIVPTSSTTSVNATGANPMFNSVFNITNPNTGTNYGTFDVTAATGSINVNQTALWQTYSGMRSNSITAAGAPTYVITPIFYNTTWIGYPTQFVTGVVPIYWANGNMGNTGDSVDVSGDTYKFFNAGTGFGVIMKTS